MENEREQKDINLILEVKEMFLAYWPLFVLFLSLSLSATFLYLRYANPTYQASAKILIKDDSKTGFGPKNSMISQLDLFGSKTNVENEMEIVRSVPVLRQAARKSRSYVKVYDKGNVRDILKNNFAIQFTPLNPDSLKEGSIEFLIEGNVMKSNKGEFVLQDSVVLELGLGSPVLIELDETRLGYLNGKDFFAVFNGINAEASAIGSALKAELPSKDASVIVLSFTSHNSVLAEQTLQAIIDSYNEISLKDKRAIAEFTLGFIEDRLALITKELDFVEMKIEEYKISNSIFDLSEQGKIFLESVKSRDLSLNQINIQLSSLEEIEKYVSGADGKGIFPSMLGVSEPLLANLLTELFRLEGAYAIRKTTVGENDALLLSQKAEIAKLRDGIKVSLVNIKSNLLAAKKPLQSEIDADLQQLSGLPSKERALFDISRQQAIKNAIYTFLLEKREESAISYASTLSDIRIIEPAVAIGSPISPKRNIIWLLGFMIGILLPAAIIFAKERFNNKILFRSDIENVLTIPIIGEVFETEIAESELVFVENSRSVIAESIRAIRTKLPFYFTHETEKVLLISSSIPGEGKSFIAANLGLSMALMGKRTLLIGGDMRKPRIHKAFDVSNAIGLSTFLIGKCQVEDTLFGTEHENLYVLPSGPIPPNPSELLMGERFQKLMVNLRVEFDFIILDTPPLGLISDPELMVKEADLSLFVVRHNHSLKEAIRKVLGSDDFRQRFPRTVLVFNGLKQRGVGSYGYGYGLGYGYGYGYGNGSSYGSEVKRATVWKRIKRIFKMSFKKKS